MLNFRKKLVYTKSLKVTGYPSRTDSVEHSKTKKSYTKMSRL